MAIGKLYAIGRVLAKDVFNQIIKTALVPNKETRYAKTRLLTRGEIVFGKRFCIEQIF